MDGPVELTEAHVTFARRVVLRRFAAAVHHYGADDLIGYGMLAGFLVRAFAGGRLRGVTWARGMVAVVLATLYGVSDEFHQLFVPGRSADRYDVLADCMGATAGAAIGWLAGALSRWGILDSSS